MKSLFWTEPPFDHSAYSYFQEKCTLMEGPLNQEIKLLQDKFKVFGRGDALLC